ncbi:hypothetical protein D9Q98_003735 [Chlorella vulgaris]|uniref:PWWP domain-containing protein n=1 Tax=Chlorella vulgaris TaxID=3077 RepID=A0A9D4TT63_CHLVU|nr:hypothetical protein D9Q98_003735 [Chlorella vulgaris]
MQPIRPGQPMGMPFPFIQNINQLSELSGIPVHVLGNPGMHMAAQQLVAQRLMQQQMLSGQLRPTMQPQAAVPQQRGAGRGGAAAKKGGGKKRGRGGAVAAPPPPAAAAVAAFAMPAQMARPADPYADPGGKLVWAKVGINPWWPAKLLDPARDLSYPADADPPRPTSIPIRFFGTFEFQWIGSKRQLADWEEGMEQYSRECDQPEFKAAIAEVERYRSGGRLPDVFYSAPEPDKPRAKARGKRGRQARADGGEAGGGGGGPAAGQGGGAGKPRAAGRSAEVSAEERAAMVQQRKKQRLQHLGLLPPDGSPYVGGRLAPNPKLLELKPLWEEQHKDIILEHQQQQAEVAARRKAISEAKAAAAAVAAAAAAAALPVAAPAGVPAAVLQALNPQQQTQEQQQQMQMAMLQQQQLMLSMQQQQAVEPAKAMQQ